MKAATFTDVNSVEIDDRQRPEPDSDELLVEVTACGVCTTDVHMYSGSLTVDYPMTPGHESAGEIVAVGDDIDDYEVGDRVAINPSIPCNECSACKSGRENLCKDLTSLGGAAEHIIEGAFSEYVTAPASNVEDIGDMDYRTAAFAEPLGCCINGVDQIDLTSGETVVIVGAGAIGLLLTQLLRASATGPLVVSEPVTERREAALDIGADYVIDPTEEDPTTVIPDLVGSVDVAIEAVGLPDTIEQAHELTGPGGRTLVFGVPPEDATVEISPFDVFYEEREIVGTYSLTPDSFARAVTLLQNGRIDADTLVTDEFSLDDIELAFEQMEAREGLKKIVYPNR
ncbi:zinc-binding dehydrogenase [Haladaptatus paucihalophilus DX253]|uniref:NADPH2:quinone reductase n=1 Tax=Haladaptatus paucihalophilus DX253 TaxID=797209 RepID=E7QPC0_HALPU|nr:zinc-dependent alcohol dehydrogenase family protein [Haladaptatus paucihalophilus]EFW94036.1 zinc-binding dehydrogenase [Haladaptatus paucihalophilus DX253]SHK63777.1 NADPH2:quinone reductase [Haladaptatus paucihalophilus DX253]